MKTSTGILARRRLRLAEFDFDVVHRAGKYREDTDAMSRLAKKTTDKTQKIPDVD